MRERGQKNSREEFQTNHTGAIGGPDAVYSSHEEEDEDEAVCEYDGRADLVCLRVNATCRFASGPNNPDTTGTRVRGEKLK